MVVAEVVDEFEGFEGVEPVMYVASECVWV